MLALSKQFDGTQYEGFTIEEFRRMAEILNHEAEGLLIGNVASHVITVALNKRNYSLRKDKDPVPIHYDDLSSVTLSGGSSSNTDGAAEITNRGANAFIANIGSGRSKTQKVVVRGIERDDIILPNTTRFSGVEVSKRITFEILPKPTAKNVADRNLGRGATGQIDFSALFEPSSVGPVSYRITPPLNDDIISVTRPAGQNYATIEANGVGTAEVTVTATNEAGPTDATVTINVA